jgi:hypothetical protein
MTTFSASVRVDDDMLHVSRPLTAPEAVADMIESLIYGMTSGGSSQAGVTSVEVVVETAGESDTPIADSVTGTSSTPLTAADGDSATAGPQA